MRVKAARGLRIAASIVYLFSHYLADVAAVLDPAFMPIVVHPSTKKEDQN